MSILVVGGAGYIGSHVARVLQRRGHEVVIYDNLSTGYEVLAQGFKLVRGDVLDSGTFRQALRGVDAVMHFAAHAYVGESVENPRKYFRNNVIGGISLLNAVVDAGIRNFIFSSSCAVYGIPSAVPIREDSPRLPVNPYGMTKLTFEYAMESYARAYGLRYVSFRYFNAAGADDEAQIGEMHSPETHLIPSAFEAIQGDRPALDVFGDDYPTEDGTCIRDYIHVNDLAEAHVSGMEYLAGGGYSTALNLGTGRGSSIREVLSTIEQVTGRRVPRALAPRRAGDPAELVSNPTQAESLLNWKATRSLEEIVSTAWKWSQRRRVHRRMAAGSV